MGSEGEPQLGPDNVPQARGPCKRKGPTDTERERDVKETGQSELVKITGEVAAPFPNPPICRGVGTEVK